MAREETLRFTQHERMSKPWNVAAETESPKILWIARAIENPRGNGLRPITSPAPLLDTNLLWHNGRIGRGASRFP